MKNSNYISKYDYINFYCKQKALWFYSTIEINAGMQTEFNKYNSNPENLDDDEISEPTDNYMYYKEFKNSLSESDINSAQIEEGKILDQWSKRHVIKKYGNDICAENIIDFDSKEYLFKKSEELAEITKKIILTKENILLFQPTFIVKNLITKPDAIIIKNNKLILIETKGTTTTKRYHLLDLFFQYKILSSTDYLEDYLMEFKLCIVKYCIANRNEVPFIITDTINYQKAPATPSWINSIEDKSNFKIGLGYLKNNENQFPVYINNLLCSDFSDLDLRIENLESAMGRKSAENAEILFDSVFDEFNETIKKLLIHKNQMSEKLNYCSNLIPSKEDNGPFKTSDEYLLLKKLYALKKIKLYEYSGNAVNQTWEFVEKFMWDKNQNIEPFFKKNKSDLFSSTSEDIIINKNLTLSILKELKIKKVYFDFETINTSIRPLNNCVPFMQIVTQCSIIKNLGNENDNSKCINLCIDPLKINLNYFKEIIDELFVDNNTSYIVYNKSFEKSRLKEMAIFINLKEYSEKVETIVKNLFDLADLFTIKKDGCPILIKELGGFYSIKKVLPYVQKNYPDIFEFTKCVNYSTLDISNGLECQKNTMNRFFKKLNNKEWEQLAIELKIYCENDVRAMIAIENFVYRICSNMLFQK